MSNIVSSKNFNAYCGRYSRRAKPKTPESKIGWYIEDNLLEKIPVLALRNRSMSEKNDSPLSWRRNRDLTQAIDLALNTLKAWQAFRPEKSQKIIEKLRSNLPQMIMKFEERIHRYNVSDVWSIMTLPQTNYNRVLEIISKIVGDISSYKTERYPMLGSKVMHLLFPEVFPVWDTAWIKNECLNDEDGTHPQWLPSEVVATLNNCNSAAAEYASYFAIMLNDLDEVGKKAYKKVEKAFVTYSQIPKGVIFYHFYDISPIVFEFCLLGKHIH
jgi:hypothetical protein